MIHARILFASGASLDLALDDLKNLIAEIVQGLEKPAMRHNLTFPDGRTFVVTEEIAAIFPLPNNTETTKIEKSKGKKIKISNK
jgi:hypothetical protein